MPPRRYRTQSSPIARAFSIALLAVALAGAQIAGLGHRIEHAPLQFAHQDHDHEQHAHDQGGDRVPEHDCSAYDAATLGDGPPVVRSEPACSQPEPPAPAASASAVADNSPHLPFHSRAPPRV